MLTNYRLIWMSGRGGQAARGPPPHAGAGVPCHLPLPAVGHAEVHGGVALLKAARLKLQVRVDDAAYPTPGARPPAAACRGTRGGRALARAGCMVGARVLVAALQRH